MDVLQKEGVLFLCRKTITHRIFPLDKRTRFPYNGSEERKSRKGPPGQPGTEKETDLPMTAYALEIKHIPSGTEGDGLLQAREGEFHAALADPRLCALLSDTLGGLSRAGEMELYLHGRAASPRSPKAALKRGVSVIAPESVLARDLCLPDHIRLLPGLSGGKRRVRKKAEALCEAYGFTVDMTAPAGELSAGDRYRGELLLALLRGSDILVLREPEAALTPLEMEKLAASLRLACKEGKTALLFTRRKGVAALADQTTLLSPAAEDTPSERLDITVGSVVLEARNLTGGGLRDVSFEARAGEILAIAGLPGSGQEALQEALTGALPLTGGRLRLNGRDITGYSIRERIRAGIACVPGPDMDYGFPLDHVTVGESMALRRYREPAFQESGFLRKSEMRRYAEEVLNWLNIQRGEEAFSENRQRCALTRESDGNIHALIMQSPTAGMAEAAARDIWERLITVRNERRAVVLITADSREALLAGDRVLTLCQGEITGEFDPALTTEKELGLYMTGRRQGMEERFDEE